MSTQARLIVMFCVVLGGFGFTTWLHHQSHVREAETMLENMVEERSELLDSIVELKGQGLRNFVFDYSYWDELTGFLRNPDPQWPPVNIDAVLPNFDVDAVWILRTDGTIVYSVERDTPALKSFPGDLPAVVRQLGQSHFAHFFTATPDGVHEFRAAPIQPSADAARATAPLGWLLAARAWDAEYVAALSKLLRSEIVVQQGTKQISPSSADGIFLHRALKQWDGKPIATLSASYMPAPLALLKEENRGEQLLFTAFGGLMITCIVLGVGRWVMVPLRALEQSLAENSPASLTNLAKEPDEFGRLARLVTTSHDHRALLEHEIEERRRVEEALRRSEEDLRNSTGLKNRLARDLHDGVIQSLYAAGLGLEGARGTLRDDPVAAERRIEAAQQSLNHTIREVRGFITGLEPEAHDRVPFDQALRTLVTTLQALHATRINLELPANRAPSLSPAEEVHALQIVRESVSNALRHGQPQLVTVSLRETGGQRTLVVRDDGRGFDTSEVEKRGHSGLANLATRAHDIGGTLSVESAAGKGTRVTLTFAQTAAA